MAHPCFSCGSECYCHGDIDDVIVCHTPNNCEGCGCSQFLEDNCENTEPWEDDEDDNTFQECEACDGHDACRDYGCAIEHGLGHLIKPPL